MRDIILLAISGGCSLIALMNPTFGALAYVGFGVLSPQSYTWDFSRTFPHSKLIAVGTLVGYFFSRESRKFPHQPEARLMLALWALFGLSTLFGIDPERALPGLIITSKILAMTFLLAVLFDTEAKLKLLLKVIALGLGLHALKAGLFVITTGGVSPIEGPPGTFLEANNTLGLALAMNVPLLYYLSRVETNFWIRWAMRAMLLFSYPAVAGTFSRGDWIGLAVITLMIIIKSRRKLFVFIAVGIFAAVITWIPYIVSREMANRYETIENYQEDGSVQTRFWNWEFCKRVAIARPVFGAGFSFYSLEAYARYFPEFLEAWPGKVWSCHNTALSILAEHGVLAAFLWIGLMGSSLLSLRRMRSQARVRNEVSWVSNYTDMLSIALIGYAVSAMFIDVAYYEGFYQLVAAILILKERISQSLTGSAVPHVTGANHSKVLNTKPLTSPVS
jgi:probable O-glycosylation ligase (exosortase A-associated)